ncbi:MAG: cytochrome-c peroxidase [Archangium sp.]
MRSAEALTLIAALGLVACGPPQSLPNEEALGRALFFDTALSANRTQSCATCHDENHGFADARRETSGVVIGVSRGDDGTSLGDRNAPTASYAAYAPDFAFGQRKRHNKQNANRLYEGPLGGFFWDGRARTLEHQAGMPPLNPLEMAMPDEAAVVARLERNDDYRQAFQAFYGGTSYESMTKAIAAFERTAEVAPFDSKYDRFLRGEAQLSFKEVTGKSVFFSQFANCAICHQLHSNGDPVNELKETFTGYEFHNLGTPVNEEARRLNGITDIDLGLGGVAGITSEQRGKFKVPTLRNVAVTGPYMHNGVFTKLRTVLEFYDHFTNPTVRVNNPETGRPWAAPEVNENVAEDLLKVGMPFQDSEIEALECFLRTLTDARYEPLIEADGLSCAD